MANLETLLSSVKKLVRERHDESKMLTNLLEALTEFSGMDAESSRAEERLALLVAQSAHAEERLEALKARYPIEEVESNKKIDVLRERLDSEIEQLANEQEDIKLSHEKWHDELKSKLAIKRKAFDQETSDLNSSLNKARRDHASELSVIKTRVSEWNAKLDEVKAKYEAFKASV